MISDVVVVLICILPPIVGLFWALKEFLAIRSIKLTGPKNSLTEALANKDFLQQNEEAQDVQAILDKMKSISGNIADGATAFLVQEYKYMMVYVIVLSLIIGPTMNIATMISFIAGCLTSCACGYIGMKTAVYANVRTAHESWKSLSAGFSVALKGGSIMGFCLVSLGVIVLMFLILSFDQRYDPKFYFEALAGYGLGASSIALFGRVGGGIYTKAADVGADLSGKNEYGMDEDDPRNPACIADNVGDNVGDIAGMGADLFGSFAESTCAAMIIAANSSLVNNKAAMLYPVVLSSLGILTGIATIYVINQISPVKELPDIEKALKNVLVISTIAQTPIAYVASYFCLPHSFSLTEGGPVYNWFGAFISVALGLWSGLAIGYVTEYYTSHSFKPVREISMSQKVSAATGIIFGLALGYMSCIVPTICLAITICASYQLVGMYGVALGALGMLGTLTMGLTIDAYGPISDNAGGIAEMSELGSDVRKITDALDAAGNTTAAIGKGFAIGSAALVSFALFCAYTVRAGITHVDVLDPWTFVGLMFGAMMPYAFSAMTMKSVGTAANDMVAECMRQFPKIISGEMKPQYTRCIAISTDASLREMIAPGALVILSPLVAGFVFGKNCTAGLLSGALVSGVQMAISMSNTGGAWDNSKKYIESGALGNGHLKGSTTHKNAVTGDTVGDPLKDTSGPSLNILVKLSAITSLVFAELIVKFSNDQGGPIWA